MSTSLTSTRNATKAQIRRMRTLTSEAIDTVLELGNVTYEQAQAAHGQGGLFKEGLVVLYNDYIRQFAKKALGIFTPVRAQDTGLIPDGYTLESDGPEGKINFANLDFNFCPVRDGDGIWVNGDTTMARSKEVQAIGSLGFAKLVLDAQKEGKGIIPVELRGEVYIILPRTVLRDRHGNRCVGFLHWDGEQWVLSFSWLDGNFGHFGRSGRFVRSRE